MYENGCRYLQIYSRIANYSIVDDHCPAKRTYFCSEISPISVAFSTAAVYAESAALLASTPSAIISAARFQMLVIFALSNGFAQSYFTRL